MLPLQLRSEQPLECVEDGHGKHGRMHKPDRYQLRNSQAATIGARNRRHRFGDRRWRYAGSRDHFQYYYRRIPLADLSAAGQSGPAIYGWRAEAAGGHFPQRDPQQYRGDRCLEDRLSDCRHSGHRIENVTLSNIRCEFEGGGTSEDARRKIEEKEDAYPECVIFGTLPAYGLYCRHVKGLRLLNVQFAANKPDARPAMVFDDAEDVLVDGKSLRC